MPRPTRTSRSTMEGAEREAMQSRAHRRYIWLLRDFDACIPTFNACFNLHDPRRLLATLAIVSLAYLILKTTERTVGNIVCLSLCAISFVQYVFIKLQSKQEQMMSQEQRDRGLAELSTACAAREVAVRSWLAGVVRTRQQKPVLFYIRCGLVFAATLFATRYLYPVSMLYALVVVTILRNSAGIGGVVGYIVSKLPRKSKTA